VSRNNTNSSDYDRGYENCCRFCANISDESTACFAQENDQDDAVLQTERNLAAAYFKTDVDGIAQGVMEDYTLTNSMGKRHRSS